MATDDERVLNAALAFIQRLDEGVGVFEGEAYRVHGLRAFLAVGDELEALYGEEEARRIMRGVVRVVGGAMREAVCAQ